MTRRNNLNYNVVDSTIAFGKGAIMTSQAGNSLKVTRLIIEALKASQDGFGVFDQDDLLIFCNEELANNFGLNAHQALGKSFEDMLRISYASGTGVIADDDVDSMVKRAKASRLQQGFVSFESARAQGSWLKVSRLKTKNDYIYIYSTDITQLKKTESALREALLHVENLAATDSLTGISNRRHFIETGTIEFERSKRYQHSLSVLMLDIDHFKSINDTFGHQAGDQVLKAITECCSTLLRSSDSFGRLGGEEFSILLPDTDIEAAGTTAQRVLNAVAALKVNYDSQVIRFTTSIGVAQMSMQCKNLEELMNQSDEALYQAKHSGRNRMERYGGG